jgi:uncharacterized hydrophobic protein (TIGR00271 family)
VPAMRTLQVQVPPEDAGRVVELARRHDATGPAAVRAGDTTLVFVTLPNANAGAFIDAVSGDVADATFVLLPVGALPLQAPLHDVGDRLRDVSRVSTLEIVIASLQSVGSWPGLILFSVLAGLIGAYGLIFDAGYLLVAAMLINPMGAPALVAVTAMAVGDVRMYGRGALRFAASLAIQAAAALALGVAYGLDVSTAMMEQITSLSNWAVLVALAAGAAGAQSKVKSDRDSLVSGTSAGFMVAAALAPPAAVLGLALALGRLDYVGQMAFLLALQFLAISLGGWGVFRAFGVRPAEPTVGRGSRGARTVLVAAVALGTIGLVAWQATQAPRFHRADLSRTALEIARDAAARTGGAALVESSARFTRRDLERHEGDGLLLQIIIESTGEVADDVVTREIRRHVRDLVRERMTGVVPFVDVTVLPGPDVRR